VILYSVGEVRHDGDNRNDLACEAEILEKFTGDENLSNESSLSF